MPHCSHITNFYSSPEVRTFPADFRRYFSHNRNMARRGIPKGPVNWYLKEWMAASGLEGRGAQTRMMELTGWSKATMSQLFNGTQDYSPKVVNEAASALRVEPFELLMHPDRAMALRRFQASAQGVVTIAHDAGIDIKPDEDHSAPRDGTHG